MLNFYWHAYKYFPYERKLAQREVSSLLGHTPETGLEGLRVPVVPEWQGRAYRTTYFCQAVAQDGGSVVPLQAHLEESATHSGYSDREATGAPILSRQSTRYSAHGLHEYRGKFNPQIVRAIGNILGLQPGDAILDPFCGSGTTILEAVHNGWNAVGIDINPLAVQIARAKVAAMHVAPADLSTLTQQVVERLDERFAGVTFDKAFAPRRYRLLAGREWELALPHLPYLRSWFRESVLVQLSAILQEISSLPSTDVQLILKVVLSDILRNVSMQDPGDLRMRRLAHPSENAPAVPLFLSSALSKIDQVLRARAHLQTGQGNQTILLGDARRCAKPAQEMVQQHRFAAALTSPPYATALPYIDTQRLSLVLFDHMRGDELHTQERRMIGSREIQTREREEIDQRIAGSNKGLPQECIAFCRTLRSALSNDTDGFRRRNTPALLYKYLTDMADMFREVHQLIEPGTPYALVVGQNKTTLSGRNYTINTPYLLTCVAEDNGFELQESVELETYQRYDIHQSNSVRTETLLILKARGNAC